MKTDCSVVKFKLDDYVIKQGKRIGIDFAPSRAHGTDAGADIRCVRDFTVPPMCSVVVDTGLHIELPPNTKCEIKSKSGLNVNHGILTTGLIDEGYTGVIKVRVYNFGTEGYHFSAGDEITQLVVSQVCYPTFEQVESIDGGERGDAGFGSTGKR